MKHFILSAALLVATSASVSAKTNTPKVMANGYPYTQVPFTSVKMAHNSFWGAANHVPSGSYKNYNSTWGEESELSAQFNKMKAKFADKGIPVLLGEFGANWRSIGNTAAQKKHDASIKLFNKLVVQNAINCGMVPMVWDVNVANQSGTTGIMTVINLGYQLVFEFRAVERDE